MKLSIYFCATQKSLMNYFCRLLYSESVCRCRVLLVKSTTTPTLRKFNHNELKPFSLYLTLVHVLSLYLSLSAVAQVAKWNIRSVLCK